MACNCSKEVTLTDCDRLRKFVADGRMFIYHIFDDERKLQVAFVPAERSPNAIAIERGFVNDKEDPEWFFVKEHPCLYE